jgi:transposase
MKIIKSSQHTTKFANTFKRKQLECFLQEYRRVAQVYVDYLWFNTLSWATTKNKTTTLDIANQQYNVPQFLAKLPIQLTTNLSARAVKCCSTQACGLIKAALEKPRKRLYQLNKLTKEGKDATKLQAKINKTKLVKPNASNIKAELNSICCDYQEPTNSFDAFLQLKCLGKVYGTIRLPVQHHRHSLKLKVVGKQLNSFLISERVINIRYELPQTKAKDVGLTLGADQGIKTVLTLSSGQTTPKTDTYGHSLESITHKLARKKKGSKAFGKAQDHRENFINWSINQLNLDTIKQINLENIINIGFKNKRSRYLSHFTNTLIRDKLLNVCSMTGVSVQLQTSTYRSQRCSCCGLVRKANRKGKLYECRCGLSLDADLNAALNHEAVLPSIPIALRKLSLNRKGFYWRATGFYDLTGAALTVPSSK